MTSFGRWLLPLCLCAGAHAEVLVTADKLTARPVTQGSGAGCDFVSQLLILNNGPVRYGINTNFYVDKSGGGRGTEEGYLGMPVPASDNWYGGGFMDVIANGSSLRATLPLPPRVVERGPRGLIEVLFPTSPSPVRLRFLLEPDTDYLACEIACARPFDKLALQLRCYPSYFTAWNQRDGWRQVISPSGTLEQGKSADLSPAADWWLFYQDTVFDYAKNSQDSDGPCAVLMLPEQSQAIRPDVGSYAVMTNVICKPGLTSARLAFWDFHKQPNAAALQKLRQTAPQVAERLRKLDFGDSSVAAFNVAGERTKLEALIGHASEAAKWRTQMTPLFAAVATAKAATQGGDFLAEQKAAEAIAAYREALWGLKFDALLTE